MRDLLGPFIYLWYTGIYLYENLIQSLIQVRYGKSDAKHIIAEGEHCNDRYIYGEERFKRLDFLQ